MIMSDNLEPIGGSYAVLSESQDPSPNGIEIAHVILRTSLDDIHGGSQDSLPSDQQEISKRNNSKENSGWNDLIQKATKSLVQKHQSSITIGNAN